MLGKGVFYFHTLMNAVTRVPRAVKVHSTTLILVFGQCGVASVFEVWRNQSFRRESWS